MLVEYGFRMPPQKWTKHSLNEILFGNNNCSLEKIEFIKKGKEIFDKLIIYNAEAIHLQVKYYNTRQIFGI